MAAYVPGPSLPYLRQRVNVELHVVSDAIVVRNMGKLIASPLVGYM